MTIMRQNQNFLNIMDFKTLFREFAEEYGIEDAEVGESGEVTLLFDDRIPITMKERPNREVLGFYARLFADGDLAKYADGMNKEKLYRDVLEYSYLGERTQGLSISLDPKTNALVLWTGVPLAAFSHGRQLELVIIRFLDVIPTMQKLALDYVVTEKQAPSTGTEAEYADNLLLMNNQMIRV